MKPALLSLGMMLVLAPAVSAQTSDTIRIEVGAQAVDGRIYQPHAARVQIYHGETRGSSWINRLVVGDSAGRPVHYWTTTGVSITPAGDTIRWELQQTYDAITLQPYSIVRTASNGLDSRLTIDGLRVRGTKRSNTNAPVEPIDFTLDRMGYPASATDLVPAAVGFKPGRVISFPVWGPGMQQAEQHTFTILGEVDVDVEGTRLRAWKVEEHRDADGKLLATWYLLDHSPYMVYGEVPLPNGTVQRMTEVEVP